MKRFVLTTLATTLCTTVAFAAPTTNTNTDSISPAERTKIETVVHEYLLSKPEVLVEALQILQRKQYEQAEKTVEQTQKTAGSFAKSLFHAAGDPIGGNPNGKVTVVEFFDYQCPHCVDMVPTMDAVIKANPDLRVVYKEFPIRGPMSDYAARATLAANMQGKYNELSHAIMASTQPLTQDLILQFAKNAGLNVEKLKKDMNDKVVNAQIEANIKLAKDLKLFGTPAFFIGKTDSNGNSPLNYIPGKAEQKQLQDEINKASK